jgi:hypothetical protein
MVDTSDAQMVLRMMFGVMAVVFEVLYTMGYVGFEKAVIILLSIIAVLLATMATDD